MKAKDLFSLEHSIAGNFIASSCYPHEVLNHISEFIESYDKTGFREITEGVWVHESAAVSSGTCIMPPCIICEGAEIRFSAFIRGNAVIGKKAVIGNSSEIKNSIIFDEAEIPHFSYVGDSILGYKAHLGAGVKLSNVRLDKKPVRIHYENNTMDTGMLKLGALIGDRAEIGCNSVINPGSVIAKDAVVYPLSSVKGFVPCYHEPMSTWYDNIEDIVKNKITKEYFTLEDVYSYKDELKGKYPDNNFIKDKIRQQLQKLRDAGVIAFLERGKYQKL